MNFTEKELALLSKIKNLVALERKTLAQVLELLQVVYDTRLYAKLGHSSLVKFLVKEHSYSESAAYRRYCALKLTREIPETKAMVRDGSLQLTNIAHLQTMLKDKSCEVKRKAVQTIQNKSSFDAKRELFAFSPEKREAPKAASIRQTSEKTVRLTVTLSSTATTKIQSLKARTKVYDTNQLIEHALDAYLQQTDPARIRPRKSKGSKNPRVIPAQVKRDVFRRAQGKCEFRGCGEEHFLEYDHVKPVALGGENSIENIRLVCKAHNQMFAINAFGVEKMGQYLAR